jgi:hypothetical protein
VTPVEAGIGGGMEKDPTERPGEFPDEQSQGDEPVMDPDPVSEEDTDEGDGPSVTDAFRSG